MQKSAFQCHVSWFIANTYILWKSLVNGFIFHVSFLAKGNNSIFELFSVTRNINICYCKEWINIHKNQHFISTSNSRDFWCCPSLLLFVSKFSDFSVSTAGVKNSCLISSAFLPLVSGTKKYTNKVPKDEWGFSPSDFYHLIYAFNRIFCIENYLTYATNSCKRKISPRGSNVSFNFWFIFCNKKCTEPVETKCNWRSYSFSFWREKFSIQSPGKRTNAYVEKK